MCKYALVLTLCAPDFMTKSVAMLPIVFYILHFNKNPSVDSFLSDSYEKIHVRISHKVNHNPFLNTQDNKKRKERSWNKDMLCIEILIRDSGHRKWWQYHSYLDKHAH